MIYNNIFIKQFANPLSLFAESKKKLKLFFFKRSFHHILIWLLVAKNLNGLSLVRYPQCIISLLRLGYPNFRKLTSYPRKTSLVLTFLFLSSSKVKRSYPIPSRSNQYPPTQLYSYNLGNRYYYLRIFFYFLNFLSFQLT